MTPRMPRRRSRKKEIVRQGALRRLAVYAGIAVLVALVVLLVLQRLDLDRAPPEPGRIPSVE